MLRRCRITDTNLSLSEAVNVSRRHWMGGMVALSAGLLVPPSLARTLQGGGAPSLAPSFAPSISEEFIAAKLRVATLSALGLVPAVGGVLSFLGAQIIPVGRTPEQMWRAYTDGRISQTLFRLVQADLAGLSGIARLYRDAVASGDMNAIRIQSISANTAFEGALHRFQLAGEREALLPLYAVAVSLHLGLLRDMILKAQELGFNESFRNVLVEQQRRAIREALKYVDGQELQIYRAVRNNPGRGALNAPLSQLLERRTKLHLEVNDLRDTWYAFDADTYPGPVRVVLDRELYSKVIGPWDGSGADRNMIPHWAPPRAALSAVELTLRRVSNIERGFLDGVRLQYANGEERLSGRLATRMPAFVLQPGESITSVTTHHRTIQGMVSMEVNTTRGRAHKVVGRENRFDVVTRSQLPAHRLSSIHMLGRGRASAAHAAGACVLGFQLIDQAATPMSLESFEHIAPVIAPQLLDWIVE